MEAASQDLFSAIPHNFDFIIATPCELLPARPRDCRAAEHRYELSPSDADWHVSLCERGLPNKGNDTTLRRRSLDLFAGGGVPVLPAAMSSLGQTRRSDEFRRMTAFLLESGQGRITS